MMMMIKPKTFNEQFFIHFIILKIVCTAAVVLRSAWFLARVIIARGTLLGQVGSRCYGDPT
jgi:hypothetical protein